MNNKLSVFNKSLKIYRQQNNALLSSSLQKHRVKAKQLVSLFLILSALAVSTPAAPRIVAESASQLRQDVFLSFNLSKWFSSFLLTSDGLPEQETQEERDAKVVRIEIDFTNATVAIGKKIPLVAVAYDQNDIPVSGVKFEWEIVNSKGERQEVSDDNFKTGIADNYSITARGAGVENAKALTVVERPETIEDISETSTENRPNQINFNEWDISNILEAQKIKNIRGNSPGKPKGKNNFNIVAPILSIPGRGLKLDLSLNYNSLVWSKLDQDISYDMDKDWLAPGWSMGFGKIINMIGGGITQIDADGSRRFYSGDVDFQADKVVVKGQSTDGTFIKAKTETSAINTSSGACFYNPSTYLKYPNGTTVWYDEWQYNGCYRATDPITMVPKAISDRHGNKIIITYHNPANNLPGRWINTISDTLGRVYTFNYTTDTNNTRYLLTSVTGQGLPDENGNTQRTFVRLGYRDHTIAHNFNGLTPHVRETTVKVLSSIYYPSTQSGYWFGDTNSQSPSYSSYGMIRKVQEQKGMNYSPETGITSSQQVTRERVYSYPVNNSTAISDTPAFDTVTESWEGMTTAAPTTTYQVNWDANPRTTTIISSDQSKVVETSYNLSYLLDSDPEKAKDAITYKTEYYGSDNQLKAKDEIEWELGYQVSSSANSKILRPKKLTQSEYANGITLTKSTINNFSINGVPGEYNQVLETTEIGYGGPSDILRRSVTEFTKKGDSPTTGDEWEALPRLINLPIKAEVFDSNNTRIGYSKYEYDLNPLQSFNGTNPPNFCTAGYCSAITERGDLSKTRIYQNVSDLTGEISDKLVYDKAGNLVEYIPEVTETAKNTYKYTYQTRYAFPEEVSDGSTTDPNISVKSILTYNYNTGLPITKTDPNLQTVYLERNPQNWRLTKISLPVAIGGYSTYDYDDINRTYTQTAYTSNNTIAGKKLHKINGLGLTYRQESYVKTENISGQNQEIWDVVESEYDEFGRAKKTSNPFRNNVSTHGAYWTEFFYDATGQAWKTVSPDGSTKYKYYNEPTRPQYASSDPGKTFRVKDPIGREKWYRTDSDGNMLEVIEPNPAGDGSVATGGLLTKYTYDRLGQLTKTEQGAQQRTFRYDSLGRLTHQKMAETKATLDSAGTFVGDGNGQWSDFYVYDKFSNITSYIDTRGVTTNYSYTNPSTQTIDPLNRLFSISYNTNGASDVLPSPNVNFAYQISGNISQLKTVTTAGVSTTDLDYDTQGLIKEKKTTLTSRPTNPMTVNYLYDSLNRLTDITYPTQYVQGSTTGTRKTVHYDFDTAGRTSNLKVDNVDYASNFVFNAFANMTSVKIGPSGTNQITETYDYNQQTGFLENQKVLRGSTALLDLSYEYQKCSCSTGGSGQIKQIVNNIDRNRDRKFDYDAVGRLKKVSGGMNEGWSQSYAYDRYGNRNSVNSLGFENLRGTNTQQNEKTNGDDQKKILSESFPASTPNAKNLLSGVKKLTTTAEKEKDNESPISLYNQSVDKNSSGTSQPQDQEKDNIREQNNSGSNSVNMLPNNKPFDFDGDGKADYSVFQRSGGNWAINKSGNNQTTNTQFGASTDQIAPADYDGDGKTDIAVWRPETGVWHILRSSDNVYTGVLWGSVGDAIVPGDYDGDNKADLAVWRPSNTNWYILRSSDGGWSGTSFGSQQLGDIPVAGDYDGDKKTDIAVWRPSNGVWYVLQSSNGQIFSPQLGINGYVPVPADYDGDGKTDAAVWSLNTGVWYITPSSNFQTYYVPFGGQQSGDVLVPADYDGDGKADIAIWRPTDGGIWYIIKSSTGTVITYQLGTSGNIPIPSAYIRRSSAPKNQSKDIPRDGLASLSYEATSNRITTTGFTYDLAGNQTRKVLENGTALRFQYDAAGRLVKVKNDNQLTMVTYTYGASRERLISQEGDENSNNRTYYAWEDGAVISEYVDSTSSTLIWTKNYIFMGTALLATQEQTTNGERIQFDHPDQLGTRVITNAGAGIAFEQNSLPFGTAIESESTGAINQRFTSYDRSASTGLDYATNRFYDSSQGRFTQVDPISMSATSLTNPQTLNLYAYTANDPVNHTDPDGLDWGDITWGGYGTYGSGNGGGTSINAAWLRFLQGLFGAFSTNYAGMVFRGMNLSPAVFISGADRYGLPNAGEKKTVAALFQDDPCGVNPVLNTPGVRDDKPGKNGRREGGLGNIRPGEGGPGGFRDRGGRHNAIDLVAPVGTTIVAGRSGIVVGSVGKFKAIEGPRNAKKRKAQSGGLGNYVVIDYGDGFYSLDAHLTDVFVKLGDKVIQGETILGTSGRTGNAANPNQPEEDDHVHHGIFKGPIAENGLPTGGSKAYVNPVDFMNGPCPPSLKAK